LVNEWLTERWTLANDVSGRGKCDGFCVIGIGYLLIVNGGETRIIRRSSSTRISMFYVVDPSFRALEHRHAASGERRRRPDSANDATRA
jgi:hypothetical protein